MELHSVNHGFGDLEADAGWRRVLSQIGKPFRLIAIAVMVIIAVIALFLGGYFIGVESYSHSFERAPDSKVKRQDDPIDIKALPAVVWDGPCPRRASSCPSSFQDNYPLVIVSLDGFRPDYLKNRFTTTIQKISRCGTTASSMYPAFPSKTFPNHYTQVTGVNPASHGIIDNSMYDPVEKKLFKIGTPEGMKSYWWQRDPIWVTAAKQGKKSACFFWPGSDVKINDTLPTYFIKYNSRIPFESRVDKVLEWLDLPLEDRPSFITMYANQPDNFAHKYGVNSKEVDEALEKVDNMVERLFSGLQQRGLVGCVDIMILSDHGMSDTDCSRIIDIRNYINVSEVHNTVGPFGRLRPKGRKNITVIENTIKQLACQSKNMRAYAKEQLPLRMHYSDNDRIEPIFLDIDAGWTITSKGVKEGDSFCSGGSHGYDNLFPDMKALFIAHGPSFKLNTTVRPFMVTELYELMAELINIRPNPNNGTRGSLHHLLKSPLLLPQPDAPEAPAIGAVPADDAEYNYRVLAANCTCAQSSRQEGAQNVAEKNDAHLPFGVPYIHEDNSTLRLLYHNDYVSAFDLKYRLPMWTSFTLEGIGHLANLDEICWKGDARVHISDVTKCSDYSLPLAAGQNVQQRPLYPPYFSEESTQEEASFVTNSVPKSLNHTKILEKKMNQVLGTWAEQEGRLNVVTGPAFDFHATGVRPSLAKVLANRRQYGQLVMPTHYYTIVTWCQDKTQTLKTCDSSKLEVTAFLLPNHPYPRNCEPAATVITKNVARVVDIENLTGISFFTGLPIYDAIRLRTFVPERVPT